jgi:hypothetical protein
MPLYNTETVSIQFLNKSFLDKIDAGMTKEAEAASTAFVRQKLRELGFTRKILPPVGITAVELDRQITDEPTVIVEKEPNSEAASFSFTGRPRMRYFQAARYPVTFSKIASREFTKSKFELATYRTDIRTILQDNSVRDMQKVEDETFYSAALAMATKAGNVTNVTGGVTIDNFMEGVRTIVGNQLPLGCILMTQGLYTQLLTQPSTQIGSPLASDLTIGRTDFNNFYGYPIITTIKNDIVPDNQALYFASPNYLGQFYVLQDATVFIKVENGDMLHFLSYESVGVGIGNTNGVAVINF